MSSRCHRRVNLSLICKIKKKMFKDNIHTLESLKLKQCNLITHTVQNMIGLFSPEFVLKQNKC